MCALVIRDDISPEDLHLRARQESDGRVAARLIAIANALEGMDRAAVRRSDCSRRPASETLTGSRPCGRCCADFEFGPKEPSRTKPLEKRAASGSGGRDPTAVSFIGTPSEAGDEGFKNYLGPRSRRIVPGDSAL